MWPKITKNYSPNFSLTKRSKKKIKFIIIHYTGMQREVSAIKRLCDFRSKVSSHYFIKKNGIIIKLVPDIYEAWHAGVSKWKNNESLNKYSIGIEIQNSGHNNMYEKFSLKKIKSLKKLLKPLIKFYNIKKENILGHSDISPDRKKDPGEKFPWKVLAKFQLALWHELNEKEIKKYRLIKLNFKEELKFLKNLKSIGYTHIKTFKPHYSNKSVIKAFQRRFRQNLVNGFSDQECLLISKNLIK